MKKEKDTPLKGDKRSFSRFLIDCFLESLNSLSVQKASLYGATIVARIHPQKDYNNFSSIAISEIKEGIKKDKSVNMWFIDEELKDITSFHDQLITISSAIYSFYINLYRYPALEEYISKLIPSVFFLVPYLVKDIQKTIGAEVLIPFYLQKLIDLNILVPDESILGCIDTYSNLKKKKILSDSDTLIFSIEGFEDSEFIDGLLEKASLYFKGFDNIEILAFLSNYDMNGAYMQLSSYYSRKRTFKINAFEFGEIFEIAWQFHLLIYSGLVEMKELQRLANIVSPYIYDAGFDFDSGVSISKEFLLKDADTTAMVFKLLSIAGKRIPLSIFSGFIQKNEDQSFFGAYANEIRPSLGTMSDILDAISYADINEPNLLEYIQIIHNNLVISIRKEENDIDKWHTSKQYFYSNSLIAYTNISLKTESFRDIDPLLYISINSLRENIAERLMYSLLVKGSELRCEERAWSLFALSYYARNINIGNEFVKEQIHKMILSQSKILDESFNKKFGGNFLNLEKMWIVKVAYSPINILKTLIHSSIRIQHLFNYE